MTRPDNETTQSRDDKSGGKTDSIGASDAVDAAVRNLQARVYRSNRTLSASAKELALITALTCLRAPTARIEHHMREAMGHGATGQELLELLELLIPVAGLQFFEHGLVAWARVTGAEETAPPEARFTRLE